MKTLRTFILLVIGLCFSFQSYGRLSHLEDEYIFKSLNTRDGLPQDTVNALVRGPMDFLWLGTRRGLARFDGNRFTVFNSENTNALRSNHITSLHVTRKRRILVGTFGGGLTSYHHERGFRRLHAGRLGHFTILCIKETKPGIFWLGTLGNGLVRIGETSVKVFTAADGLPHNIITALYPGKKDLLWVGTPAGLYLYTGRDFRPMTGNTGLPPGKIYGLYRDDGRRLWVACDNGLYRGARPQAYATTKKTYRFSPLPGPSGAAVFAVTGDRGGTVWAAGNRGLYRILPGKQRGTHEAHAYSPGQHFNGGSVLKLHIDREDILWMGTRASGFGYLYRGMAARYTVSHGLPHPQVTAIFQDSRGNTWLGTRGGLTRLQKNSTTTYTRADGLSHPHIRSITEDRDGNLWFGTEAGLNRFSNGVFRPYTTRDGLTHPTVRALCEDSRRTLWIGTYGGGLNRLEKGKITAYTKKDGLSNDFVLCLGRDNYDNIWAGTLSGLNCMGRNGFEYFSGQKALAGVGVSDIHTDPQGTLWIATLGKGLYRYDRFRLVHFEDSPDFAGSAFYRAQRDTTGRLWLSSPAGLYMARFKDLNNYALSKKKPAVDYFLLQEWGLRSAVFSGSGHPAGCETRDGRLWFATHDGAVVFKPGKRLFRARKQRVHIDKMTADGKPIPLGSRYALPAGTRRVEFHFSAPNFIAPQNIKFKYRMRGYRQGFDGGPLVYEKEWILAGHGNKATYHDLPSGALDFTVTASNTAGTWDYENYSEVTFFIAERFYETMWFYMICIMLAVAAAVGVPAYFRKKNHQKERVSLLLDEEKYKTYSLPKKKSRKILNTILDFMEREKPYLEPTLTMPQLAKQLGISKEELSQVINKELFLNFNAFVNTYRINEAKRKLKDPRENQFIILKIAHDVGFNSKSSFNAVFKKITGLSPSEYRKKYQKSN